MPDPAGVLAEHAYKKHTDLPLIEAVALADLQLLEAVAVEAEWAALLSTDDSERMMHRERAAAADAVLYLRLRARVASRSLAKANKGA
jgi:hypothetical protein